MSGAPVVEVAVITADSVSAKRVFCKLKPAPREINLLFALSEHVNKIISIDALCSRLKVSENSLRISACKLRKKLTEEWTIMAIPNKGLRLIFLGGELIEADRTFIEIDREALRVRRVNSPEARRKMSEAAIKNKAHERFYRRVV